MREQSWTLLAHLNPSCLLRTETGRHALLGVAGGCGAAGGAQAVQTGGVWERVYENVRVQDPYVCKRATGIVSIRAVNSRESR